MNTELYIENLLEKLANNEEARDNVCIQSETEQVAHSARSMRDMINGFQKRVDMLKKSGKEASISVVDDQNVINVHITISKN